MSRKFGVPIEVWTREERPVRFMWRGRVYSVRWIVEHWVALRQTWRPEAEAVLPRREYWRVRAGFDEALGVYELSYDSAEDQWHLVRVWD